MSSAEEAVTGAAPAPDGTLRDAQYTFDETKLETVRQAKLWTQDPKYFKRVSVSPSAAMKMMLHGQSGVDKGCATSGKPIEVMGLLLGRPDTEDEHSIIITDAQPLPIEGFETKVIADDQEVINYMIDLSESLALTRKERFCGWYHTHPFDVGQNSNCFMSNTDISTQLMWQLNEDAHGNPWVAIVIDPLRSIAKSRPEMIAFRAYPPDHMARSDETPDGKIVRDDKTRLELWGACWNRYYALEVTYHMSELASNTLSILRNNSMWKNAFSSSSMVSEGKDAYICYQLIKPLICHLCVHILLIYRAKGGCHGKP
jgi:COP9 signalosome complex subunit 5